MRVKVLVLKYLLALFCEPTAPTFTAQDVTLTRGITNSQLIHLVDLFRVFVSAASEDSGDYDFQNEVI